MKKCAAVAFVMLYLASQSFCSQSGGAGQTYVDQWGIKRQVVSRACVGGPPDYCAPTDMRIMYDNKINYTTQGQTDWTNGGPAVGVPFIDPDDGNEVVRVTDISNPVGQGQVVPGGRQSNIGTNSAAEEYQFSAYNPTLVQDLLYDGTHMLPWNPADGGYVFKIIDNGGNSFDYALDAVTMQTQQLTPPTGDAGGVWAVNGGFSLSDPWLQWGNNDITIQYYCFPGVPSTDPICGGKGDTVTSLFTPSASNCGNPPSGLLTATAGFGDVQADRTDTIIGGMIATGQAEYDREYYMTYNRSTGDCFWVDMFTGNYGGYHSEDGGASYSGTLNSTGTNGSLALNSPTGTQTAFVSGTGSLTGGFCVETTYIGNNDPATETAPNAAWCTPSALSSQAIQVSAPALITGNVYFTQAVVGNGGHPYGAGVYACQEVTVGTPCSNFTEQVKVVWSSFPYTLSTFTTSGAAPNTISQAGIYLHQSRLSENGNYVLIVTAGVGAFASGFGALALPNSGNGWTPTFYFLHESGHQVPGFNTIISHPNNVITDSTASLMPNVTVNGATKLTTGPTAFGQNMTDDYHPSWAADNASDTMPFCGSTTSFGYTNINWSGTKTSGASPDGTWTRYGSPGWTNSAFNRASPYFGDNLCWSTATSGATAGVVWRFGGERNENAINWNTSTPCTSSPSNNIAQTEVGCTSFQASSTLGSESPDGKFLIFTSYWDWDVGCSQTWWKPHVSVNAGTLICAPNGVIQDAKNNGMTGWALPTFGSSQGQTVTDGTETWEAEYPCGNESMNTVAMGQAGCFATVMIERLK